MSLSPKDLERRESYLIKEDDDDPRMTLGYITQAWTDIRSYTSNIWQVAAVGMAVIVLALNAVVSSVTSENPLPPWMILGIGIFALVFLGITSYSIAWFRRSIAARVEFISKVEERLIEIKGSRLVISGRDLFSVKQGPLKLLLFTFYFITFVVVEIIVFESGKQILPFLNPSIDPQMTVFLSVIFKIWFGVASLLLFQRGYHGVRVTEDRAQNQADIVVKEQVQLLHKGIKLEEKMNKKLKQFADKYGYKLEVRMLTSNIEGVTIREIDAILFTDKFAIPIEAKLKFSLRTLKKVREHLINLNLRLGVIVTDGDFVDERWILTGDSTEDTSIGKIGVLGVDADFDIIQTWIQRIEKE